MPGGPFLLNLSQSARRAYFALMFFADKLTLDKARRTSDGYMAIRAKAARTGIYQYLGREVDPEGKHFAADQVVNVYRPPEEVFSADSLASFVGKPITNDHPTEGVDANNWRDLAHGTIMGAVKDGDYVGFDLAFMDAKLIAQVDAGKRELSNGYVSRVDIEDGEHEGVKYQAVQREIRGNHIATVDAGRAGSECRIGDAATCIAIASDQVKKLLVDQRTYDEAREGDIKDAKHGENEVPKIIIIDGLSVDISNVDTAEATIKTLIGQVQAAKDAKAKVDGEIAQLTTDKATLTAENVTLKAKVEDAKITPAMLRDAAKSFADVSAKAKTLGVTVTDAMGEAEIKRAVVDAKLGDAAKGWTDEQVGISFTSLTADVKVEDAKPDALVNGLKNGGLVVIGDGKTGVEDARRGFLARKESAYLGHETAQA